MAVRLGVDKNRLDIDEIDTLLLLGKIIGLVRFLTLICYIAGKFYENGT